jgi:hypothetical protein
MFLYYCAQHTQLQLIVLPTPSLVMLLFVLLLPTLLFCTSLVERNASQADIVSTSYIRG